MTGITIAIPTYNRVRLLRRTLESLFLLERPAGLAIEIIVINNNCTDETSSVVEELAREFPFPIRMVVEPKAGLNHGRNRALDEAAGEQVVYFDDDVHVSALWLKGCVEAVDKLQADCVVGPVTAEFERDIPCHITPAVLDSLVSSYSLKGESMIVLPPEAAHELPGCGFSVRKSVAVAAGRFRAGLDRQGINLLAGGDFDFGRRLARGGWRVVYHPDCAVRHIITAEKLSKAYLRRRWAGCGATARMAANERGRHMTFRRRARHALGVARLLLRMTALWIAGRHAEAFEQELEARKAWSYMRA
jgi:glycosyltransferase involved in cell wall biosynthesis